MPRAAVVGLALAAVTLTAPGCSVLTSEQRSTYRMPGPVRVEEPAFPRSLDNFGSTFVDGNGARLLENGDGMFGAMLEDIREAKGTINLETYIYKADKAGRLFTDALAAAARRGVEVRLMVDAQGSSLDDHRKELEEAGVICRDYRPAKKYNFLGRRTHRKLLVIDGAIGYTGGFCFDERWLGDARNPDEWHDVAVRVTGPVVSQMQAIFGEGWTFTTGEILAGERFFPKLPASGGMLAQAMKASKGDPSSLPKMLYFMAIEASRKSIHIQNSYFLPDSQIRAALVRAARRGVEVQVMVPGPQMDIPLVRMASRHDYGELLKGGVRIHEYQPTMIHSKTLVVDGIFTTIGSINFDARSMSTNAELSVSFYDPAFAAEVEAMFDRDRKLCHEVSYEAWKDRGLGKKLAETFSRMFKPLY